MKPRKQRKSVDLPEPVSRLIEDEARRDKVSVSAKMVGILESYSLRRDRERKAPGVNAVLFWIAGAELRGMAKILGAIASRIDMLQTQYEQSSPRPSVVAQYIELSNIDLLVSRSGIEPLRLGAIAHGNPATPSEMSSLIAAGLSAELLEAQLLEDEVKSNASDR